MFDAAFAPTQPPEGCNVAAGYLRGGEVYHAWTQADWERVSSWPEISWLLPIGVAEPGADGHQLGLDHARQAVALGCPRGVTVALDVEQNMAEHCRQTGHHRAWCDAIAGSGFVPMIYTSESAKPTLEPVSTAWWLAEWTGQPHEIPGAAATQYTSPTVDHALAVDLSTVTDSLALWPLRSADSSGGGHVAPTLNAPVCEIVATPTGSGYWLVAEDGGVFAFGDAKAFPDPVPHEHLARPVTAAACTPKGDGLWLVGADGGVFALGAAAFHGSIPSLHIDPAPEHSADTPGRPWGW